MPDSEHLTAGARFAPSVPARQEVFQGPTTGMVRSTVPPASRDAYQQYLCPPAPAG